MDKNSQSTGVSPEHSQLKDAVAEEIEEKEEEKEKNVTEQPESLESELDIKDKEKYDEITEYIREVDEILDFIKPFPRDWPIRSEETEAGPSGLVHPVSTSMHHHGMDHLSNLVKLVEQLKDLKDKNSKLQERAQYLKDLKNLRERKKRLKYEAAMETNSGSPTNFWQAEAKIPATTEMVRGSFKHKAQSKKFRSSLPFRKNSRGRSKSVNIEDCDDNYCKQQRYASQEPPRRKSSSLLQKINVSGSKAKVSKWTKVKEAFRWEKASHTVLEPRQKAKRDEGHFLQVPHDKGGESHSDSALSGHVTPTSSVGAQSTSCLVAASSGYSGEHSSEGHSTSSGYVMDLPPPPPPPPLGDDDFLSLPLIQDLSSSSSSEKLDELLTFTELLCQGSDSTRQQMDMALLGLVRASDDPDMDMTRRSKSLDGDLVLGPSPAMVQHFRKESLMASKLPKMHKTPWGKVKDIIQTRKGSLKKKPKRSDDYLGSEMEVEELSSPEEKPRDQFGAKRSEGLTELSPSLPTLPRSDSVAARRLTPVLTITLPSTEELRGLSRQETRERREGKVRTQSPTLEERRQLCEAEYLEDIPKYDKGKPGAYHRRFSRWSKVKRAFLTSTSPTRGGGIGDYIQPTSLPSSPNRHSSFFSDVEWDELSSGEWAANTELETAPILAPSCPSLAQSEIQKSYLELQHKLTREFNSKIREWERTKPPEAKHDDHTRQRNEEWDKTFRPGQRLQRESLAIPMPTADDLSPEFKKKLDEWKKIKKSQTTPAVPHALTKEEPQGQHFKMRIGEWQRWKPGSSHKVQPHHEHNLPDEFCKKLEEWQKMKGFPNRRSRSHSDRGKDERRNRTPSPRLSRKNSSKGAIKKVTSSGKSSGTESLSGSLKEKDRASRRAHKEKDLQWLEKELQKIEREKTRLEREREKYLEREARLERMKRTMDTTSPTQEVLIQTPTGFFRFEGISQKFTKKLYEWEKARGIAPEASTFTLLEECAKKNPVEGPQEGMSLQRSKSVGSVIEISPPAMVNHPSSLSLNDVDELEVLQENGLEESRASSEPTLAGPSQDDEPSAMIVDVEDVVVETAALMADVPIIQGQVPVYSYAPAEVTQLIDSSGSDGERDFHVMEEPEKICLSTQIIEDNMVILERLEVKEAICRKLENDMEDIEGKINDEVKTVPKETESHHEQLRLDGENLQHSFNEHSTQQSNLAQNLVDNLKLLHEMTSEVQSETLSSDQTVGRVQELSSQLLFLAQKLETAVRERNDDVRNMQSTLYSRREKATVNRLQTGQFWYSADGTVTGREDHDDMLDPFDMSKSDQETGSELSQLPSLITKKVLELKCGLNILKNAAGFPPNMEILEKSGSRRTSTDDSDAGGEVNTASFVVQFAKDGKRNSIVGVSEAQEPYLKNKRQLSRLKIAPDAKLLSAPFGGVENLSPVTVTITPPFWTKREDQAVFRYEYDDSKYEDLEATKLEKSRAQLVYGEAAAHIFEKNSKQDRTSPLRKSPDLIRKKIKEKISLMQRMTTEARPRVFQPLELNHNPYVYYDYSEDESPDVSVTSTGEGIDELSTEIDEKVVVVKKNGRPNKSRKMLKTRRVTDTNIAYKQAFDKERTSSEKEDSTSDDVFLRDDHARYTASSEPVYIHFQRKCSDESGPRSSTDVDSTSNSISTTPPINVFVPTTRKIISPVRRDSRGTASILSYVIDDIESGEKEEPVRKVSFPGPESVTSSKSDNKTEEQDNVSSMSWKSKFTRALSASPGVTRKQMSDSQSTDNKSEEISKSSTAGTLEDIPRKSSSEATSDSGTSVECLEKRDIGMPPLPLSPTSARKTSLKEAAPSIRMIIAKFNQKLTEQDGGSEAGSGAASPVVWRSPVSERRVKVQMERFEDDVNRALKHGGKFEREVRKSASAGYIRTSEASSRNVSTESLQDTKSSDSNSQLRGILKSSSAGVIKPSVASEMTVEAGKMEEAKPKELAMTPDTKLLNQFKYNIIPIKEAPSQASSAVRALRIKRAKEEFLSRGPGGQSWTSDMSTPATPTSPTELSPWTDRVKDDRGSETKLLNRLSHVSVGSESSYEESYHASLTKSASAGMINIDPREVLRRCSEGVEQDKNSVSGVTTSSTKSNSSKFGLASIKSRFRKVKMRKAKEKDTGKMTTVSTLCRQSLLLDVSNPKAQHLPSTSKSCPSSPVLERGKMSEESRSWIRNPAKKIFKSKEPKETK